jgi:hypothetical protein
MEILLGSGLNKGADRMASVVFSDQDKEGSREHWPVESNLISMIPSLPMRIALRI